MALLQPELWVQGGGATFPAGDACTFLVGFRRNTDLTGARVLMSRNWNGAAEGMVLYEDGGDDNMYAAWFTGGGGTSDATVLASRPAIGTVCNGYLAMRSTGEVRAGYATIAAPTTWVVAETATPIGSHGSNNAMSLTSNANGALIEAQRWCAWDAFKPETDFDGEIYSALIGNASDILFQIPLNDGNVTSPWPTISGPGGNDATQQGGIAPTNVANFLADLAVAAQPALPPLALRTARGALALGIVAPHTAPATTAASSDVTGTMAATLGNDATAASGAVVNPGSFTSTLANLAMAASGVVRNVTTFASTLANSAMSAAGLVANAGAFASTLGDTAMSAAGLVDNRSAFASTLGDTVMAANGTAGNDPNGALATTLANDAMAASGLIAVPGLFASMLGGVSMAAAGGVPATGTLSSTLGNGSMAANGFVGDPGEVVAPTQGMSVSLGIHM